MSAFRLMPTTSPRLNSPVPLALPSTQTLIEVAPLTTCAAVSTRLRPMSRPLPDPLDVQVATWRRATPERTEAICAAQSVGAVPDVPGPPPGDFDVWAMLGG